MRGNYNSTGSLTTSGTLRGLHSLITAAGDEHLSGSLVTLGPITAFSFTGLGSGLTAVPGAEITGSHTVPSSTLPTNVSFFADLANATGYLKNNGSGTFSYTTPSTSDVSEGSNLYFTNERVDDRVAALLVEGTGITLTYNDSAGTLTIDSTGGGGSFDPTADIAFSGNNTFSGTSDFQGPLSATGDIGGDIPVNAYSEHSTAGRFEGVGNDGLYAISDTGNGLTASSASGAAIFALSNSGGTAPILIGDNGSGTVAEIYKNGTIETARRVQAVEDISTSAGLVAATTSTLNGLIFLPNATDGYVLTEYGAGHARWAAPTASGSGITTSSADLRYVPLTRTVNGHALSSNVTVTPTDLSLVIGTNTQAWDTDLDTYAATPPSSNAQTILGHTFSQMRTDLGLVIGTNVEAWDTDLDTYATLPPSANFQTLSGHTFSQMRIDLGLVIGTNTQAWDATLDAFAALTIAANSITIGTGADAFSQTTFAANTFPARASTGNLVAKTITDFGLSLVDDADASTGRATLGLGTLATQSGTFSGTSSGTNTGDQSGANPTAIATGTAINGSASTWMRSDAAPAIQTSSDSVPGVLSASDHTLLSHGLSKTIVYEYGGGATVPTVGALSNYWTIVPTAGTITNVTITAQPSGSAVVNIWKITKASFPPTVSNKITASAPPTLSSAVYASDSTLTGWTTSISANDCFMFNLDSVSGCTKITVVVTYTVS